MLMLELEGTMREKKLYQTILTSDIPEQRESGKRHKKSIKFQYTYQFKHAEEHKRPWTGRDS